MRNLSNWRSVRLWDRQIEGSLRQRHTLWLHGPLIGSVVLLVMWASAHLQMVLGSDSLALRYSVTLGIGYVFYLMLLRLWAGWMLGRENAGIDAIEAVGDLPAPDLNGVIAQAPGFHAGGGGDFGGGGASADFSDVGDAGSALGDVAGGALEVVGSADEGAVVVIPVVVVFLIGCALVLGAGSLLLLYFGSEALLTVAVELAFSYVSARTAIRVVREGWLSAAVRLTWKPLLGSILCAVLLGAALDYFIPAAQSLPDAVKLMRGSK